MQKKELNITFNKSGGTASKGGVTTRLTIPITWIREMGITEDSRKVSVCFDGEKIIITKDFNHEK